MQLNTRELALLSVLTALCVGIQITPRPPSIEFTSLICFTVGAFYGCWIGGLLGGLTMFINGFLSPWGFAGINLPFQILGMVIVGLAGGIFGRTIKAPESNTRLVAESSIIGGSLTLLYDVITNLGFAVFFGAGIIPIFIAGIWFSVIHVGSNTFLFASAFLPLLRIIERFQRK